MAIIPNTEFHKAIDSVWIKFILIYLQRHFGVVMEAAKEMGLNYSTLLMRIRRYGIDHRTFKQRCSHCDVTRKRKPAPCKEGFHAWVTYKDIKDQVLVGSEWLQKVEMEKKRER